MQVRSLLLVVFLGLVAGCGANQRQNTIKTTLVAFNAARDGFLEWDDKHQDAIVAKAATGTLTKDEAKKALETYRKARENVVKAIILTYRAIALAATQDDGLSLSTALAEAKKFYEALQTLKGN